MKPKPPNPKEPEKAPKKLDSLKNHLFTAILLASRQTINPIHAVNLAKLTVRALYAPKNDPEGQLEGVREERRLALQKLLPKLLPSESWDEPVSEEDAIGPNLMALEDLPPEKLLQLELITRAVIAREAEKLRRVGQLLTLRRKEYKQDVSALKYDEKGRAIPAQVEEERTAIEWNKKLDYGIIDYDGFDRLTLDTYTMTEQEFKTRAQKATRRHLKKS